DTRDPWRRAMQGHAVSNVIPVVAANRTGLEPGASGGQNFYGSSFIADHRGQRRPRFPGDAPGRLGLLPRPEDRPLRGARARQGVRAVIETPRLVLRRWCEADRAVFLALHEDP